MDAFTNGSVIAIAGIVITIVFGTLVSLLLFLVREVVGAGGPLNGNQRVKLTVFITGGVFVTLILLMLIPVVVLLTR